MVGKHQLSLCARVGLHASGDGFVHADCPRFSQNCLLAEHPRAGATAFLELLPISDALTKRSYACPSDCDIAIEARICHSPVSALARLHPVQTIQTHSNLASPGDASLQYFDRGTCWKLSANLNTSSAARALLHNLGPGMLYPRDWSRKHTNGPLQGPVVLLQTLET